MMKPVALLAVLALSACTPLRQSTDPAPDAPQPLATPIVSPINASSYEQALELWQSPEDVNNWIATHFSYDSARAGQLSETQRAKTGFTSIYSPSELFVAKAGVCVDLSRFGVETLRQVAPQTEPKYLMIEFEPVQANGETFRLHWLVRFKGDGGVYFFADSKRPRHMAGPYPDTQAFVTDYERYRGRKIVKFRELDSYQKRRRSKAVKQ